MSSYLLTSLAQNDIVEILDFIKPDSPKAAERIQTEIQNAMKQLAVMPGMGHLRQDLAEEELRFWSVQNFLIIYRHTQSPIQIIRVLHHSRDVQTILKERDD